MDAKIVDAVERNEGREAERFRRAMEKYDGMVFEILFPKDKGKSGIVKGPRGFYQVCESALCYDMGTGIHAETHTAAEGTGILDSYEKFEQLMEEENYNVFDVCLHEKNRGVCAASEGKLLSEDGDGYFCCVLKWTTGNTKAGNDGMEYAMLIFDPSSKKFSRHGYFETDKAMFDLMYGLIGRVGERIGK